MAESFLRLSQKNPDIKNIRWTPKENLHITLFFIGEIEEKNLSDVKVNLENIFIDQKTFSLEFESVILKGKKHPSMIWVGFRKNEFFRELSEKIHQSIKDFMTVKSVHHDPIPHCTLARLKPGADISSMNRMINLQQPVLKINTAELWQTEQTKDGVRYVCLQKFLMND